MAFSWPWLTAAVNDLGDRVSGSAIFKADLQELLDDLNLKCFSATFPAITPEDTTDAVENARGGFATVKARLDSLADPATGVPNPATFASYVTVASHGDSLQGVNLCPNDTLLLWSRGAALVPDHTVLQNATIVRTGLGEADTTRHISRFAAKMTWVSSPAQLYWDILTIPAVTVLQSIRGIWKFSFGMWLKTTVANAVRAFVFDNTQTLYSAYHPGDDVWRFMPILAGVGTLGGAATRIIAGVDMSAAGSVYAVEPCFVFGSVPVTRWFSCPTQTVPLLDYHKVGAAAAGNDLRIVNPLWPCLVQNTQLTCLTVPAGAATVCDLDSIGAGVARTALYSAGARPQIAVGAAAGSSVPDAAWSARCLRGVHGGAYPTLGGTLSFNVDSVGATPATDFTARVTALRFKRPDLLDQFGDPADGY